MSEPRVSTRTWVWSDTHFGHKNIVKFQQRPETHEVIMLSAWVRYVRDQDTILHLGDVAMGKQGNPKRWMDVIRRMPGRKLLILGNHDGMGELYEQAGFEIVDPFCATVKGVKVAFTHRPISATYRGQPEHAWRSSTHPGLDEDWQLNIHGHIHLNDYGRSDDGKPLAGRLYKNVSVEAIEFCPRQVGNLLGAGSTV